jgi:hypothetical protein
MMRPVISPTMALSRGPPGKLIQRAQLGFRKAMMPKINIIIPIMRKRMLGVSILSFSSLFLFEGDGGSVDEYFGGASHNCGGHEADVDHCICA